MLAAAALLIAALLTPAADSALARRLWFASLDQQAALNLDSALVLVEAARRADPAYMPAQFDYIVLRHRRFERAVLRRERQKLAKSADPFDRCLALIRAHFVEMRDVFTDMLALEDSAPSVCADVWLALTPYPQGHWDSFRRVIYARALREAPDMVDLWASSAEFTSHAGDSREAERILNRGIQTVRHPLATTRLQWMKVQVALMQGDTAAAEALRRQVVASIARDGRPGLRPLVEGEPCVRRLWGPSGDEQSATQRSVLNAPRVKGDWAAVAYVLIGCGHSLIDRGEPSQALVHLTRALRIADSVRLPDLWLETYLYRGRALEKLGKHSDATHDLARGLALGADAGWMYNVAFAHGELAQVYAGAGRWEDANREAERFVSLAAPMRVDMQFTSALTLAQIRWNAGWHASARTAYADVVRLSDEQKAEYYWGGEYFERIGDLARARTYYEKATRESSANSRAQSGLVRVYEQLGQLDSAESVARVHDRQIDVWTPLEHPLTPEILARHGDATGALRLAGNWATRLEKRGNIEGACLTYLEIARVALDARRARAALTAAEHADSLAASVHFAGVKSRSATVRGRALQQLGAADSALTLIRTAAAAARRDATADDLFEAQLALGDIFAARALTDSALVAYDGAARTVERITAALGADLDRVRYRDRHLLPFDGAVSVLARAAPSGQRLRQLVDWSARRKAAALALATHAAPSVNGAGHKRVALGDLTRALGPDEALLDYVVLDSLVAVVVITADRASLVRLGISADTLRAMIERLRRPLTSVHAGRIDVARAPYDLALASALYASLIRPIAELIVHKSRLMIVPDGPLHALSFEALVTTAPAVRAARDYRGATYLIDAYAVEYVPSTALLGAATAPTAGQGDALARARMLLISYEAPGAQQEATALSAVWPSAATTILAGAAATERAAKSAMSQYGLIHFVVHAEASARDPLASHLRLAGDPHDDGFLNVGEIARLRLTAQLVVLSACETDAGPIYNGEGVMGLARAFLVSGAQAVIGTQWPVGSETAALMQEFYRRLVAGEGPPTALRAAKLRLRSSPTTAHPFFWAGAILVEGSARR